MKIKLYALTILGMLAHTTACNTVKKHIKPVSQLKKIEKQCGNQVSFEDKVLEFLKNYIALFNQETESKQLEKELNKRAGCGERLLTFAARNQLEATIIYLLEIPNIKLNIQATDARVKSLIQWVIGNKLSYKVVKAILAYGKKHGFDTQELVNYQDSLLSTPEMYVLMSKTRLTLTLDSNPCGRVRQHRKRPQTYVSSVNRNQRKTLKTLKEHGSNSNLKDACHKRSEYYANKIKNDKQRIRIHRILRKQSDYRRSDSFNNLKEPQRPTRTQRANSFGRLLPVIHHNRARQKRTTQR